MSSANRIRKQSLIKKVYELVSKHEQVVIVNLLNVGSNQVQKIRADLEKLGATLVIGKNTVIKKAMNLRVQKLSEAKNIDDIEFFEQFGAQGMPQLNSLIEQTKGKIGLIFSDTPAFELKPIIESHRVKTTAKVGMISQCDVIVPTGPTGLDPAQISFFHALQMTTKINKGQIEIVKEFQVCFNGEEVTNSAAVLLKKLNITPFEYGMELIGVYSNGSILSPEIVSITPDSIVERFQTAVSNISAMSLALNLPTAASVPHMIANSFKNICAISLESGFEIEAMKNMSSAPAVAAPVEEKKAEVQAAAPEEEEEEEDVDMGDLFGDF